MASHPGRHPHDDLPDGRRRCACLCAGPPARPCRGEQVRAGQGCIPRHCGVLSRHLPAGPVVLALLRVAPARIPARSDVLWDSRLGPELRRIRRRSGPWIHCGGTCHPVGRRCGAQLLTVAAAAPHHLPAGLGSDVAAAEQPADPVAEGQRAGQFRSAAGSHVSDRTAPTRDRRHGVRVRDRSGSVLLHRLRADAGDEPARGPREVASRGGPIDARGPAAAP